MTSVYGSVMRSFVLDSGLGAAAGSGSSRPLCPQLPGLLEDSKVSLDQLRDIVSPSCPGVSFQLDMLRTCP